MRGGELFKRLRHQHEGVRELLKGLGALKPHNLMTYILIEQVGFVISLYMINLVLLNLKILSGYWVDNCHSLFILMFLLSIIKLNCVCTCIKFGIYIKFITPTLIILFFNFVIGLHTII